MKMNPAMLTLLLVVSAASVAMFGMLLGLHGVGSVVTWLGLTAAALFGLDWLLHSSQQDKAKWVSSAIDLVATFTVMTFGISIAAGNRMNFRNWFADAVSRELRRHLGIPADGETLVCQKRASWAVAGA